jgi:hypothetical protein
MALGLGNIALLMLLSGGNIAQLQHIIKGMNIGRISVYTVAMVTMLLGVSIAFEGTVLMHDVVGSMIAGVLAANTIAVLHRKKVEAHL